MEKAKKLMQKIARKKTNFGTLLCVWFTWKYSTVYINHMYKLDCNKLKYVYNQPGVYVIISSFMTLYLFLEVVLRICRIL